MTDKRPGARDMVCMLIVELRKTKGRTMTVPQAVMDLDIDVRATRCAFESLAQYGLVEKVQGTGSRPTTYTWIE